MQRSQWIHWGSDRRLIRRFASTFREGPGSCAHLWTEPKCRSGRQVQSGVELSKAEQHKAKQGKAKPRMCAARPCCDVPVIPNHPFSCDLPFHFFHIASLFPPFCWLLPSMFAKMHALEQLASSISGHKHLRLSATPNHNNLIYLRPRLAHQIHRSPISFPPAR
jgi:hypothetical protein